MLEKLFSAFVREGTRRPVFDNTRRVARIAYRTQYYARIAASAFGRLPVSTQLRTHFPFAFPDGLPPANLTVEFTNYCNLACTYCTSPLGIRTRGFMDERTFALLVAGLREFPIPRVRIVGNGESTLHPRFCEMVIELAKTCPYLTMVTNLQRLPEKIARTMLQAPVRLIEISVDADNAQEYERSRVHGNFEKLVSNLELLRRLKRELRSPSLINIRCMIRPTQIHREKAILNFWSQYADVTMPQYLHDYTHGNDSDVFTHYQKEGLVPRCSIPTKHMLMHWNGRVPICEMSQQQTGVPEGVIVGDIHTMSLKEIWTAPLFEQYRRGHRKRDNTLTPICKGCIGG